MNDHRIDDRPFEAPPGSFQLKDPASLCNDIAIANDGTAYVADSFTPTVFSLKPGGTALEVWATDPVLAPAKDGVGLGPDKGKDPGPFTITPVPLT
ncbi:hypothetical protein [Bradyrhizobium sp. USDA 10063]